MSLDYINFTNLIILLYLFSCVIFVFAAIKQEIPSNLGPNEKTEFPRFKPCKIDVGSYCGAYRLTEYINEGNCGKVFRVNHIET